MEKWIHLLNICSKASIVGHQSGTQAWPQSKKRLNVSGRQSPDQSPWSCLVFSLPGLPPLQGLCCDRKAPQSGCLCQQASRISREIWAGPDRAPMARAIFLPLIGRTYEVTVHGLERGLAFNNLPSPVWLHAFVARQITCSNAASDTPTATLLSLSSQICLRYACHSNSARLIAFKIEMERRCQLLNTSPSRLLAVFEAVKLSCSSSSEVPKASQIHPAMFLIVARIRD